MPRRAKSADNVRKRGDYASRRAIRPDGGDMFPMRDVLNFPKCKKKGALRSLLAVPEFYFSLFLCISQPRTRNTATYMPEHIRQAVRRFPSNPL